MAPKNKDKAEEVEAEATEETVDPSTKVTVLHEKHAEYIKDKTGIDVDPLAVFLVYSTRVAFRKTSDAYKEVKLTKAQQAEAAELAKTEAKAAREKEREEKAAAKAEADEAKAKAKAEKEAERAAAKEAKEKEAAEKKAAKEAEAAAKSEATPAEDKPAKGRRGKGKQT